MSITTAERQATEQQLKDLAIVGRAARDRYAALHTQFLKLKAAHEAAVARCALAHAALVDHAPLDADNFPTEAEQATWQHEHVELTRKRQTAIEARNLLAVNLETTRADAVKASQVLERALWQQRALQIKINPDVTGTGIVTIG